VLGQGGEPIGFDQGAHRRARWGRNRYRLLIFRNYVVRFEITSSMY
jgi:hypothetical protein